MKDYVLELAAAQRGTPAKLNLMREYLQAYVLRTMHDHGAFRTTAFVGGTALRFLHGLPRFSEDLDFSLTREEGVTLGQLSPVIKRELIQAGYTATMTVNDHSTVHSAFIKFEGLLHEAGISPHPKQNLSIKLKVDTHPPEGAVLETEIVNKYFPLSFLTYDTPSLFAGKTHALLTRKYTKGRDFFDLGWYLSRWRDLAPNLPMLCNALRQTRWPGEMPGTDTWRTLLSAAVTRADWKKVTRDVSPFLERPADLSVLTRENIFQLLGAG